MAQVNTIPGVPSGWPNGLSAVSPTGSDDTGSRGDSSVITSTSAQTNPQTTGNTGPQFGVVGLPQGANQEFGYVGLLPTSTLKASAPGVLPSLVTQAS
jgi:hypothetical protein